MFRICKIIKNPYFNYIPREAVQTVKYYDKKDGLKGSYKSKGSNSTPISKSIRNEVGDLSQGIKQREIIEQSISTFKSEDNIEVSDLTQDGTIEEGNLIFETSSSSSSSPSSSLKPLSDLDIPIKKRLKTNSSEPFSILSYKAEILHPKPYTDSIKFIRDDYINKELQMIDVGLYPIQEIPVNQAIQEETDSIKKLTKTNGIEYGIKKFHSTLIDESSPDVNIHVFSYLLSTILQNRLLKLGKSFFKYYVNEYYKQYLHSQHFLIHLRLIHVNDVNSITTLNEIYQFLLESNLVDYKVTLIFTTFYLEINNEQLAIELFNNSFKKLDFNQKVKKSRKFEERDMSYSWNYDLNDRITHLNIPIVKYDKNSEESSMMITSINKLFLASNRNLQFYKMLSQFFLENGIITSTTLVQSLIGFSNLAISSNRFDILNEVYQPYKDRLCKTTSQTIAMVYYYADSRSLFQLKDYIYSQFIFNNKIITWKFREDLLNYWIVCYLEVDDYGQALRASDIKDHIQSTIIPSKNDNTVERVDYDGGLYQPFIEFHQYYSERIVDNFIRDFNINALNFWKLKRHHFIKAKGDIFKKSYNIKHPSSTHSRNVPKPSQFKYSPLGIKQFTRNTDNLMCIIKDKYTLYKDPTCHINRKYKIELSKLLSMIYNNLNYNGLNNFDINKNNNDDNELINLSENEKLENCKNFFKELGESPSELIGEKKLTSSFYYRVPHSTRFIALIQHFRTMFLTTKKNQLNYDNAKLEDYFKLIAPFTGKLKELLTVPNDWYLYLYSNPTAQSLNLMTECLSPSVYKSADFYNLWLHKISDLKKSHYIELTLKLIKFMLDNSIPIYKKPLILFTSFLFNSNQPIPIEFLNNNNNNDNNNNNNNNNDNDTIENSNHLEQSPILKLLNDIESLNCWLEYDILKVLKLKLTIFPNNDFLNKDCLDKDLLIKAYKEASKIVVKTPELIELKVQLISRIYPIPPISNFQYWLDIGKNLEGDLKDIWVLSVCQNLSRQGQFDQLTKFLDSNKEYIASLPIPLISDLFKPLPPIKQAIYLSNHIKMFTFYKPIFVDYVKHLKIKLLTSVEDGGCGVTPSDYSQHFSNLDLIISKERTVPINENIDFNGFISVFSKIYLNK
ncbi:hypothetical protein ACTFIW_001713 [Dictyostelium discoideum]